MQTLVNATRDDSPAGALERTLIFVHGLLAYSAFLATFVYGVGFIGDFLTPTSLDSPAAEPWYSALLTDLGLLSLFAVQHSVMARPFFKRWITKWMPASAERSTYVLASSVALAVLFWQWKPLGGSIWEVDSAPATILFYAAYAFGWALVFISTVVINHFDLFGLRQVWRQLRRQPQAPVQFTAPILYRIIRHPLYMGWLFVFWSTPRMTASHLFFAVVTTAYILVAIRFEEADLVREHPQYAAYRQQVPMLIPRLSRDISFNPSSDFRRPADQSNTSRAMPAGSR